MPIVRHQVFMSRLYYKFMFCKLSFLLMDLRAESCRSTIESILKQTGGEDMFFSRFLQCTYIVKWVQKRKGPPRGAP